MQQSKEQFVQTVLALRRLIDLRRELAQAAERNSYAAYVRSQRYKALRLAMRKPHHRDHRY